LSSLSIINCTDITALPYFIPNQGTTYSTIHHHFQCKDRSSVGKHHEHKLDDFYIMWQTASKGHRSWHFKERDQQQYVIIEVIQLDHLLEVPHCFYCFHQLPVIPIKVAYYSAVAARKTLYTNNIW